MTHAFVVFEDRSLEHKEPRLPSPEILTTLRQVPFLVTVSRDGLVGSLQDVRGQKRDDLVVVLHGQIDERLQVIFQHGL